MTKPVIKNVLIRQIHIYNTSMKNLIKSLLFVIILTPNVSFSDTVAEGKKLTFDRKKG